MIFSEVEDEGEKGEETERRFFAVALNVNDISLLGYKRLPVNLTPRC